MKRLLLLTLRSRSSDALGLILTHRAWSLLPLGLPELALRPPCVGFCSLLSIVDDYLKLPYGFGYVAACHTHCLTFLFVVSEHLASSAHSVGYRPQIRDGFGGLEPVQYFTSRAWEPSTPTL